MRSLVAATSASARRPSSCARIGSEASTWAVPARTVISREEKLPRSRPAAATASCHASRGQQRTIILSLKLAETDLLGADGAPTPIVLLDDVFSELDADRSDRTLSLLLERGQVLVTMADLATLPAGRRGVTIWQVGEGRLSQAPRVA